MMIEMKWITNCFRCGRDVVDKKLLQMRRRCTGAPIVSGPEKSRITGLAGGDAKVRCWSKVMLDGGAAGAEEVCWGGADGGGGAVGWRRRWGGGASGEEELLGEVERNGRWRRLDLAMGSDVISYVFHLVENI
jgi:hypothetical protein